MDIQKIKERLKNKVVLSAFIAAVLALVYKVLEVAGFSIPIAQGELIEIANLLINILVVLGIVVYVDGDVSNWYKYS